MVRPLLAATLVGSLALLLSCKNSNTTVDPTADPANCRLSKILYDSNTSPIYDAYTYNSDGTVAKIENVSNGKVVGGTSFSYTNGQLARQQTQGEGSVVYTYTGTDLSNARLLSQAGSTIGNLAIGLDAAKRISTITLRNLTAFEGVVATLTYDASGNCTQIESKLPNGAVMQRTTYSSFDKTRSYHNTLNGLIFDPDYTTTDYITYAPTWKFGPSAPNQVSVATLTDGQGKTLAAPIVTTATLSRTANQSGLTATLKRVQGITSYFEYTGCQ
jgi:hypothetical protein